MTLARDSAMRPFLEHEEAHGGSDFGGGAGSAGEFQRKCWQPRPTVRNPRLFPDISGKPVHLIRCVCSFAVHSSRLEEALTESQTKTIHEMHKKLTESANNGVSSSSSSLCQHNRISSGFSFPGLLFHLDWH